MYRLFVLFLILSFIVISCTDSYDKTAEQPIISNETANGIKDINTIFYDRVKKLYDRRTQESLKEAKELLLQRVQSNPKDGKAYLTLAQISEISISDESEQINEREKYLKRALEINPGDVTAVVDMTSIYFHRKQYKKAQVMLHKTIEIAMAENNRFGLSALYDFLGQL